MKDATQHIKRKARRDSRKDASKSSYQRERPYQEYVKAKARLRKRKLSPKNYELEIKRIVGRLGI